ncbi:MAG: hypothetical protein P8R37_09305 [Opitutae bacterium]|nr:hypothetical protein [Opitutae bacterium]
MLSPAKNRKMNPLLVKVIFISVAFHLLAGLILGSYIVVKAVLPSEAQFEEPPVVEQEEPPPPVKVQIKPQQPKQQQAQRLSMRPVANIAVANVDINLPDMDQSFTVSSGLGGMGGGSLLGGTRGNIGMGLSDVSVFGLKTRAERILFVIDANRQMVTDKKGGLNSYKIIKDEITDMVGNLSAGTLFNVMLQDRTKTMLFKPQLVSAGSEVHQQLIQWINPINASATEVGLEGNRLAKRPKLKTLPDEAVHKVLPYGWGGNETGFITQVALEQGVDAIFFISGYHRGFETFRRHPNEREQAEWERKIAKPDYIKQLAKHKAEIAQMQARIKATMAKIDADRKKKGQPPRVLNQRHGVYSNARELGIKWTTNHPGHRPSYEIKDHDVLKYFRKLVDELYENDEKTVPSVNVVLFLAGDEDLRKEWKTQLDKYVRFFRGKNRVIRGEDEITRARSSKSTRN